MTDETVEAYERACDLIEGEKPLELEQHALNALAMHDAARVHRFSASPPVVAEVALKIGTHGMFVIFRTPAPKPQPVAYEHRGLVCETHGQAAHRRVRIDIRRPSPPGEWVCIECVPLPSE